MKIFIIIAIFLFTSCTTSKFSPGTYRVASVRSHNGNAVVKLEGFSREFVFPTDTLKKGDLIYFAEKPEGMLVGKDIARH